MGSAKVVKESDTEMTVTLSKDTNVELRSADEIGEKGVSNDGKGTGTVEKGTDSTPTATSTEPVKKDAVAPVTPTGDNNIMIVYGILGALLALCLGFACVVWRKKRYLG